MAPDSLIDQYLAALAPRVRARHDRVDLLDEVADHLYTAAERLQALGVDSETAQRRALARLGEPRVVASLLTSVPSKGSIVSLFFSRHLGFIALLSAALWIVASIAVVLGNSDIAGGWTQERYLVSSAIVAVACLVTTAALIGVNLRATGRFDGSALAIAAFGAASVVASAMLCWVVAGWMTPLAVAVTWTFVRAGRHHAGSRVFGVALVVAMPLIAVASIVFTVIGFTTDLWLDPLVWTLYGGLALVLVAGLVDLGVRLVNGAARSHAAVA